MLRLAFDFIITWRETRTRPNAYYQIIKNRQKTTKQQNNKERIIFFPLKTFFDLSYCHFNKKEYLCSHKRALQFNGQNRCFLNIRQGFDSPRGYNDRNAVNQQGLTAFFVWIHFPFCDDGLDVIYTLLYMYSRFILMCVVFYNTRVFSVWRFFNFSNDNKDDTYHSLDSIPDYDMLFIHFMLIQFLSIILIHLFSFLFVIGTLRISIFAFYI